MNEPDGVLAKLQRIQQLWIELGRTKLKTPEYERLIDAIRVLSVEYQGIVDASKKPQKSKNERD